VHLLKSDDEFWEAKVSMRPLVDLVREGHKDGKKVDKVNPEHVTPVEVIMVISEEPPGEVRQRPSTQHKVVTIRLYKVVASYRRRVDVVLAEWTDKRRSHQRQLYTSPRVRAPVHQTAHKKGDISFDVIAHY